MTVSNDTNSTSVRRLPDYLPDEAFKITQSQLKSYPHSKKVGNYLIGKNLGEGSFAKVKEGLHVVTGEKVAVKIISKEKTKTDAYVRKNLRREGRILQQICHGNVVHLYEVLETQNSYYLILELCQGGDMMDYIVKKTKLSESETRKFIRQIIVAIDYMHKLGILHRDLKIENLLLTETKDVKIIDFGLSNMVKSSEDDAGNIVTELCKTQCGSPAYAAPEVLSHKPYGHAVDAWSIGVNMFAMLTGNLPFTVKPFNIKILCQKMMSGEINQLPKEISKHCKDLLYKFLNPNPELRIKLSEAMKHPWISDGHNLLTSSPFPNKLKPSDIHSDILHHMSHSLGMKAGDITRQVVNNTPGNSLATYHLLTQKLDRYCQQKGIPSISKTPVTTTTDAITSSLTHNNSEDNKENIETKQQNNKTPSPEPVNKRIISLVPRKDIQKTVVASKAVEKTIPEMTKATHLPFHVQRRENNGVIQHKSLPNTYTPITTRALAGIHPMKETTMIKRDQTNFDMSTTKEKTVMTFSTPKKERLLSFDLPNNIAEDDSFNSALGLKAKEITNIYAKTIERKTQNTNNPVQYHRPSEYHVNTGQTKVRMPANYLPEVFLRHSKLVDKPPQINGDLQLVSAGTTPATTPQPKSQINKSKTQINETRTPLQRAKTDSNKGDIRIQHYGANKYARVKVSAGKVRPSLHSTLTNGVTGTSATTPPSNSNHPFTWRNPIDTSKSLSHQTIKKTNLLSADFVTNGHLTNRV